MTTRTPAALVLEDGRVFRGEAYGSVGQTLGEVVFCTGMTGYQETLTDPSYHRQIVVQTAPQIGNTGWNDEDDESGRIWVSGLRGARPGQDGVELALAARAGRRAGRAGRGRHQRRRHQDRHPAHPGGGAMRAGVFSGAALADVEQLVATVAERRRWSAPTWRATSPPHGATWCAPRARPGSGWPPSTSASSRTRPRMLAARGIETHVLPASSTVEDLLAVEPDGVFLSNGPGDPATQDHAVELTRAVLGRRIPLFGICFGNQILGRALGLGTYKLRYGHRGINIPVIDLATGRVAITAQNHGFALEGEPGQVFDSEFGAAQVSHYCPNDGCVEGIRAREVPAFSVQYHPEAAAGPHDAAPLFDEFCALMDKSGAA